MRFLNLSAAVLGAAVTQALAAEPAVYPSPWASGEPSDWAAAYAQARAFVSQLTVTEKVNLTTGTGWNADRCVGVTGGIPRLNFSALCLQDGPIGVRYADLTSAYPAGVNAGATWSRSLLRRRGAAMGTEFRGKGVDVALGPAIGPLGLFPEGGRNWEGFSPDPYLSGVAVAETVKGMQEDGGVVACAKHYVMNEQEHYRNSMSAEVDDKTMHEVYLWPFADAVRAGVGSVMCSYNKIRGAWACENPWTNNYLLKNELDFQGFIMSDWGAQHTSIGSALAGLDMAMPGDGGRGTYNSFWGGALTEAVLDGTIPQWRLDDMAVRIMAAYFKVHVGPNTERIPVSFSSWTNATYGPVHFSSNRTFAKINDHIDVQGNHGALVRELAAKSIVLLKNKDRQLPLKPGVQFAVIGEDAQDNPAGPNGCVDRGCNNGTLAMAWGSGTTEFPYLISPATALEEQAKKSGVEFINVKGNYNLDAAREAAAKAEVAIVFGNANAGENYITVGGNAGDRNNLTLWNGADALVAAVASVNSHCILVLHTVGPVLLEQYKQHENITAIVWAGLPGQESGNSLVDVLYGTANPQGKSPFTWGKRSEDWGVSLQYVSPTPREPSQVINNTLIDYRYFDAANIEPSYEFGFGLSYTTFAYSGLLVSPQGASPYEPQVGVTRAAPTYGLVDRSEKGVQAAIRPEGFDIIPRYVYSWLTSGGLTGQARNASIPEGSRDGSAQRLLPAGGAPGGNSGLYDVLYHVNATVTNTGSVEGTEITQLYIGTDDPAEPPRVLRGFDDITLSPGQSGTVSFELTYRDLANWDSEQQDWVLTKYNKTVFVGSSSRQLHLNFSLPLSRGRIDYLNGVRKASTSLTS